MSIMTTIQVSDELRKRLKRVAALKDITYDELINELLNYGQEKNPNGFPTYA
jgi:predicted transcriptional regulator